MTNGSTMRIAPATDGVSIWSSEIFGGAEASRVHDFLSRAFAVTEVESVELQRAKHFGRIRFQAVANPAQILKKLGRALRTPADAPPSSGGIEAGLVRGIDTGQLYLDGADATPVHVSRIGGSLSTWRVRKRSESTLHLWHPILRNRRDVVFRLEEELAAILGVEDFRASALSAGVSIRFDKTALTVEQLARELEKTWPRLLRGLEGPPSQKRFVAAGGLLALAFTGQYLVPALRPVAVAGVALYSAPNVVNGVKQAARREVGLPALYSTGLAFMLLSGMPFASTAITMLMQLWPRLARQKVVDSQRRLFARQRRRPVWARLSTGNGKDVEVPADELREGDLIVIRSGEVIPVDGIVERGSAAVFESAPFSADHVEQRSAGDPIGAGAFVHDGSLTIRVERAGTRTTASYIASLLPHAPLAHMPSSQEAERIANRNAKPALALSAVSFLLSRILQPSQTVLRPDYATAPRLSAQLSAFHGLAHGLQEGVLFRNSAALDRLARADVYVIDDTAGLERRRIEVGAVQTVKGISEARIAAYAMAAYGSAISPQSRALASFTANSNVAQPKAESVRHYAGVTRYRDSFGSVIEITTADYIATSNVDVPRRFHAALARQSKAWPEQAEPHARDSGRFLRPLWVLRDGQAIGVVSFARSGEVIGKEVVSALKAQNKRARFVYLSRGGVAEARALAEGLAIEFYYGGLDQTAKAGVILDVGRKTIWVGDGTHPDARESIAASTVSVSVAPLRESQQDAADILLPEHGLAALPAVIDVGRAHERRLARDYRTVYAANLLGVGGAFLAQFNSLQAGVLSNLGTGIVYARHALALDRLASAADAERARMKGSGPR